MKISVIVPVYNAEKYLSNCLECILSQSVQTLEIICVDDGSIDASLSVIQAFAAQDSRVRYCSIPNGGVAAARNQGLSMVTGEYIFFCDADDTIPSGALEALLKKANQHDADVVVGGYADVLCETQGEKLLQFRKTPRGMFRTMFFCPCLWNKLIRTSIVQRHQLSFSPLKVGEDIVFLSHLYCHSTNVQFTGEVVYQHWIRPEDLHGSASLNHIYSYDYFADHIACRKQMLDILAAVEPVQSKEFVYLNLTQFLIEYSMRIVTQTDRENIFRLMQSYVADFHWAQYPGAFEALFGTSYTFFIEHTLADYLHSTQLYQSRDMTLLQFRAGQIGMQYILKYLLAYISFKKNQKSKEEK